MQSNNHMLLLVVILLVIINLQMTLLNIRINISANRIEAVVRETRNDQ